MNKSLIDGFIPGKNLTIDEQLVTFRGRSQFRQYMPFIPGKYGIKISVVFDSETNYCLKIEIYTRKEENRARATNLGYDVIMRLIEPFKMSVQIIAFDNFSRA